MISNGEKDITLLYGSAYPELAEDIGKRLNVPTHSAVKEFFADGESHIVAPNVRGKHAFVFQPTTPPNVDQNYMQLYFTLDALRRSSAAQITVVAPYLGYSRQDKQNDGREAVSIAVCLRMMSFNGANRLVTIDPHSEQSLGSFSGGVDKLYASKLLVPHIERWNLDDIVVVSPDQGGVDRALAYSNRMQHLDLAGDAFVVKHRDKSQGNKSKAVGMVGDVKGKNAIIIDDMIDTAGSTVDAARMVESRGAKSIRVVATHAVLSDSRKDGGSQTALDRMKDSPIYQVMVTNTVAIRDSFKSDPFLTIINTAPLLAEAILRISENTSVKEMFELESIGIEHITNPLSIPDSSRVGSSRFGIRSLFSKIVGATH